MLVHFLWHWPSVGPARSERVSFTGIYLVGASVIRLTMHAQQTYYVGRCWCWSKGCDPGQTLDRYWYNVSCLLVCAFIAQQTRYDTLTRLRCQASNGPALGQRVVFAESVATIHTRAIIKPILLFWLLLNLFFTVNYPSIIIIIFYFCKRKEKIYIVSVCYLKGGPPVSGHLLTLRRVSLTTCIPNTLYEKCI